MTSGEISSMLAMRISTSARISSGSWLTSCAALPAFRCARINAMVCGCSPRMNFESWSGLAFSSVAKPALVLNDLMTRSRMRRDRSGPSDLFSSRRACSTPPVVRVLAGGRHLVELGEHDLALIGRHAAERRHFAGDPFDLLFLQELEQLGRLLLAERHHDDGRFARAAHRLLCGGHGQLSLLFHKPRTHEPGHLFGLRLSLLRDALGQHRQPSRFGSLRTAARVELGLDLAFRDPQQSAPSAGCRSASPPRPAAPVAGTSRAPSAATR